MLRWRLPVYVLWLCFAGLVAGAESSTDEGAIHFLLDNFHDAADKGDRDRYLGYFAEEGVFMGTDDWERWPLPAFSKYVAKRFEGGQGWSYKSVERHIKVAENGRFAWFDEITESAKWGRFRGTGVLVKQQGNWKVAHYAMSFLVPNEVWEETSKLARRAFAERSKPK